MNTHETYVSLEVAKLLKKAGFDWIDCNFVYAIFNNKVELLKHTRVINDYESNLRPGLGPFDRDSYICKYYAPTLEVAQRWLREVKGIVLLIWYDHRDRFGYSAKSKVFDIDLSFEFTGDKKTYEEAQEAGIKKCLTLILEKDE